MHKTLLFLGAICGLLAVTIGAFGAHGLMPYLSEKSMQTFQTANRYHFYHTLAVLFTVLIHSKKPTNLFKYAGYCFLIGIFLFSGSLYLLSTKTLLHIESWAFLGPVTPVGGLFFIIGWLLIAFGSFVFNKTNLP